MWKDFNLKWNWAYETKNHMHAPSEERNLRMEGMSKNYLIYGRLRLISWPVNTHQESLPILKPVNLQLGLYLGFPLFTLPALKHSRPQPFNDWPVALMHELPNAILLLFQKNSSCGNRSLLQSTSRFRLTVFIHELRFIFLSSEFSILWLKLSPGSIAMALTGSEQIIFWRFKRLPAQF